MLPYAHAIVLFVLGCPGLRKTKRKNRNKRALVTSLLHMLYKGLLGPLVPWSLDMYATCDIKVGNIAIPRRVPFAA